MKILFVGGNFDNDGGRQSSLVNKFAEEINQNNDVELNLINGGYFNKIEGILESAINYDIVLWWANIPNDYPKIRNVKEINFRALLVTSKRNNNNEYTFSNLINKSLEVKANLTIEFSKNNDRYDFMLFDPLGACWYKGNDIKSCSNKLIDRLSFLNNITRMRSIQMTDKIVEVPNDEEFFEFVRSSADIFHEIIMPDKGVTRFLGNSSFRCTKGFPTFRKDNYIFVSRRNVDKRFIDRNNFVPTFLGDNTVCYYGENKPSVDTPIQLNLYKLFPKINYMLHSHCYAKNAIFTNKSVPCGALEEVEEIKNVIDDFNKDFYIINLKGHGLILMSDDVEKLKTVEFTSRNMPEAINID